jgi:hypothetical protein
MNNLHTTLDSGAGQFSISPSGTLAYVRGGVPPPHSAQIVAIDRKGSIAKLPIDPRPYGPIVRLSPDGSRLAVTVVETARRDLWVLDIARGTASRLNVGGEAWQGVWSPDGRFLAYQTAADGTFSLGRIAADGSGPGPPEVLATSRLGPVASSWSLDGTTLATVQTPEAGGQNDIWALALTTTGFPLTPVIRTPFSEDHAEFSPDNRWLAYQSKETGRAEVYLQRYGGPAQRIQVTRSGGTDPAWNPTSKPGGGELFCRAPDEAGTVWMTVFPIRTEPALVIGPPRRLFSTKAMPMGSDSIRAYDVTPDGQRFLLRRTEPTPPTAPVTHINLIENWFEELKKKAPAR